MYLDGSKLYTADAGCPHAYESIEPVIAKYTGVNPRPVALFEVNDNLSTACGDLILQGQSQNIREIDYSWTLTLDGDSYIPTQDLNA